MYINFLEYNEERSKIFLGHCSKLQEAKYVNELWLHRLQATSVTGVRRPHRMLNVDSQTSLCITDETVFQKSKPGSTIL